VKRYVVEPESGLVRDAMARADAWFMCRVGYVETVRAVGLAAGAAAAKSAHDEFPAFAIIEVDQRLAEDAGALAIEYGLRSLDALHLASARILPEDDLVIATWDRRLHGAAGAIGFDLLPSTLN
jgi:predicted nucleic acid-binding protein